MKEVLEVVAEDENVYYGWVGKTKIRHNINIKNWNKYKAKWKLGNDSNVYKAFNTTIHAC